MSSERQLIERAAQKLPSRLGAGLRVGIGDDAAVIRPPDNAEWVVTTDAFLENVHFVLRIHSPEAVGYKALARATSDLAAMGARPRYFLLSLALPASCTEKWFARFLDGMSRAACSFGLILAGGDTTRSPLAAINITVIGEVAPGQAVLRTGARPGNLICVSGTLGEAELGLQLLQRGWDSFSSGSKWSPNPFSSGSKRSPNPFSSGTKRSPNPFPSDSKFWRALSKTRFQQSPNPRGKWKKLLRKHCYPEPRLALGQWLAKNGRATAMIDTSDGLSTDLAHLCEASGVGARVWADRIPKVAVPIDAQMRGLDPLRLALDGGEDYELLFTVPKRLEPRLARAVRGVPITIIGEIMRGRRILLMDDAGKTKALAAQGWDPFRR